MKSILGVGNALTDILAVLPDDRLLNRFHLPIGSMQHVDKRTGDEIWQCLKQKGVQYVAGGSAANAITCTAIFGMPSSFIGKVGDDEIGHLFRSDQEQYGINSQLLVGKSPSGRAMVFITGDNAERTFATYLGSALELVPSDLNRKMFEGYDYVLIEGYLVQNQDLCRRAIELAHSCGAMVAIDLASYNVVESNCSFLHDMVDKYIDIVFANETESLAYTGMEPEASVNEIAKHCKIAIVKLGKDGSLVKSGNNLYRVPSCPCKAIDATGAGDAYAGGFLYGHSLGMPLPVCGQIGSIISSKVVEVIGTKIDIPRWRDAKIEIREIIAKHIVQ